MNINNILRHFLIGGIFILPFVAFLVVSDFFFPYIAGKNFAFRILTEFLLGAWVLLAIRDAEYRPRITWPLLAVSATVLIMGASTLLSPDISKSFWSNYERMDGYVTLLHLFGYFLVLGSVLRTEKLWYYFFHTSIVASVIMAMYGYAQLTGLDGSFKGGARLTGTLGNAAYMASYMMIHIFITGYYLLVHKGGSWARYLYGAVIAVQIYILYYTATRGAILGLIGGVVIVALMVALFEKENKRFKQVAIGVLGAVLLFVSGFIMVKDMDFVKDSRVLGRFASISLDDNTTESRFLIWGMAAEAAKERPLLGWGYGNFTHVFNKYYEPEMYKNEPWFDRAHNLVFDWLIAGGILGLLSYISIYLAVLYVLWRGGENDQTVLSKSALTGLLAAYVFQNLFVFDNVISYMLFFMVLAYVHHNTHAAVLPKSVAGAFSKVSEKFLKDEDLLDGDTESKEDYIILITGAIITVCVVFIVNYKPMAQNLTLMEAIKPNQFGFEKNLEYFEKALSYNSVGTTEVRERLAIQASQLISSSQASQSLKERYVGLALHEMEQQRIEIPQDAKYTLFHSSLLSRVGQNEEARTALREGLTVSPHKEQIIFELAVSNINAKNYEEAFDSLQKVYDATPESGDATRLYAVAAIYMDKQELADKALLGTFATTTIADQMFVNAYAVREDYIRVTDTWKSIVAGSPNNPQFRINLAASYLELGEQEHALESLKKAKELDPSLSEQIDYYIEEVEAGRTP